MHRPLYSRLRQTGTLSLMALLASLALSGCGDDAPVPMTDAGFDASGGAQCAADTACDDGLYCNGIERCAPASALANARGCIVGSLPCITASCDETADVCGPACVDDDGDGVTTCELDCDDANAERYPGAPEFCDDASVDEDCNETTFGDRDVDGDGYTDARCCNGTSCGEDCDDTRAGVHPALPEVCNRRDDDCSGVADDDDAILVQVYPDLDRDGDGDDGAAPLRLCAGLVGFASTQGDCEDAPGPTARLRSGRTPEVTDGLDNNCNGAIDEVSPPASWFEDLDGDGYGTRRNTRASTTVLIGYALLEGDCNDADAYVNPGAPFELCNSLDDDCDGFAGFGLGVNDFEDDDGDGFTDDACTESGTDCDDGDPQRYLGAPERCNMLDDDCDGTVDEACSAAPTDGGVPDASVTDAGPGADAGPGVDASVTDAGPGADAGTACTAPQPLFRDADADSYGSFSEYVVACPPLAGYVTEPTDCNDADAAINPLATDTPGTIGVDDDCNGTIDG